MPARRDRRLSGPRRQATPRPCLHACPRAAHRDCRRVASWWPGEAQRACMSNGPGGGKRWPGIRARRRERAPAAGVSVRGRASRGDGSSDAGGPAARRFRQDAEAAPASMHAGLIADAMPGNTRTRTHPLDRRPGTAAGTPRPPPAAATDGAHLRDTRATPPAHAGHRDRRDRRMDQWRSPWRRPPPRARPPWLSAGGRAAGRAGAATAAATPPRPAGTGTCPTACPTGRPGWRGRRRHRRRRSAPPTIRSARTAR